MKDIQVRGCFHFAPFRLALDPLAEAKLTPASTPPPFSTQPPHQQLRNVAKRLYRTHNCLLARDPIRRPTQVLTKIRTMAVRSASHTSGFAVPCAPDTTPQQRDK